MEGIKSKEEKQNTRQVLSICLLKIKEKQFQKDELGEFDQWSEGQKQIYTELCFDLSKKLGY